MSLLSNQTDALDRAGKLDREELEKRLGVMEKTEGRILGAIYNGDTYGKMNMLLYSNPAGIVAGLTAAVKLSQAQGAVLVTDCEINEQEYMAAAGTAGLDLVLEKAAMVNKAAHKKDRMMTFEELAALAERLMGREPGIFAAVDEEVPVEAAPDTPVTELLGTEDYRGILTGHQFYSREQLKGLKIKDLKTWGGYIQTIRPSDCVVDLAAKDVLVLRRKCCGKCTFCREGLYQISRILEQVSQGRGTMEGLNLAREIGQAMEVSCNCSLGDRAGVPAVSMLEAISFRTSAIINVLASQEYYYSTGFMKGNG